MKKILIINGRPDFISHSFALAYAYNKSALACLKKVEKYGTQFK